eukprot:GHVP01069154.1.p1 GENE.GHVP01069154.1~~GHVP01069154.1.p1  ORF type:complete len:106 (+),score=21.86 GHVP01069154.1:199-516(+)
MGRPPRTTRGRPKASGRPPGRPRTRKSTKEKKTNIKKAPSSSVVNKSLKSIHDSKTDEKFYSGVGSFMEVLERQLEKDHWFLSSSPILLQCQYPSYEEEIEEIVI